MSDMDRRTFLRNAAMATAAAAVGSTWPVRGQDLESRGKRLPGAEGVAPLPGVEWHKAPCRFCGTGCHVQVGVKEGRVAAIAGDPQAAVNKGLLCVKGYHVGGILYGEDRLREPLLRKNGKLVPIGWDEAIDIIARRILRAPEKFGFYGSGQWTIPEGFAAQTFMKAGLSNNNIEPNARLCMASAVTGFLSTYGVDEPASCYDDLDVCDVVIMWGNNPAEMHPVLFSRIVDRRSRGETVQIVDLTTRTTRTSQQADRVLFFEPGSDLAVANGIAHILIRDGTWDREFVERYCNFRGDSDPRTLWGKPITFDEYKAFVSEYTPEKVAKISGLSVEDVEFLGKLFGDRERKIVSLWCMGMNQHTQGTAINNLVHAVHLLSGHWGKPGDGPQSLTGQPAACGTAREVGTLCHALPGGRVVMNAKHREQCEKLWNVPPGRIKGKPGLHTLALWREFCTPGGAVDTIWVQVTNPGQSLPNAHELFLKKKDLPEKFLIVNEVYPTKTTELADLVLPASLWVEKNGVYGNSERRTQQWFKMVEPPGQARDDCWTTIAVAHRLYELGFPGMKDKDGKFLFRVEDDAGKEVPVWKWEHYYDVNVDEVLYERYRPFTHMKHKNVAPYRELVKARGLRWPVVEQRDGSWRETRWRFVEGDDPFVEKGKGIQFYHSRTKDDRALIWFRPYVPPPEVPGDGYDMWLCTGRVLEHWHTGTMTGRVPQLQRAMPRAYAELHPEDARALGVSNGDVITISTRRGEIRLPVWINGRGRPRKGSIFVPFFDAETPINELTNDAHDPFSKQPDYKKCAVRVGKRSPE
ncbi:MAG: twin-arginine translocation signal domain-containing protein [Planctomycetota bacterium]|nr:MAG: twin-arginine translocation signal domain-containing protein [Planctomycetota bacterium]